MERMGGFSYRDEAEKFFRPENPMTPEDFNSILSKNIANVHFEKHAGPNGNLARLSDRVLKLDFNPFDTKTWGNNEIRVRQYQIEISSLQSLAEQARVLVRNLVRVHFDLQNGLGGSMEMEAAVRLAKEEILTAEAESKRFYREYPEWLFEVLQRFK